MAKYYGNFKANNGTSLIESITDNNLARIRKRIKSIAAGEVFVGNYASVTIYTDSKVLETWETFNYSTKPIRWHKVDF